MDEQLLAFLHERDVACPGCGYNLRGLTSDRCPECGVDLHLTVATSPPSLKAWIALVISSCLSGGIGLLLWVFVLRIGWAMFERLSLRAFPLWMFLASPFIGIAALTLRRQFLRLPHNLQWLLASASIAYTAAAVVLHVIFAF